MSSESFGAANERTGYVAMTRGREQAVVFTDDRESLLKAVSRPDDPLSATELAAAAPEKPARLMKHMSFVRGVSVFGAANDSMPPSLTKDQTKDRGLDHAG